MEQTTGLRRPWHASLRAAALGGASLLVIATLGRDSAVGAGVPVAGPPPEPVKTAGATLLAQGKTGGGATTAAPKSPATPLKDGESWTASDVDAATDMANALTGAIPALQAAADAAAQSGVPGWASAMKGQLEAVRDLLDTLGSNGTATAGGIFDNKALTDADKKKLLSKLNALRKILQKAGEAARNAIREVESRGVAMATPSQAPTAAAAGGQLAQGPGVTVIPHTDNATPTECAFSSACTGTIDPAAAGDAGADGLGKLADCGSATACANELSRLGCGPNDTCDVLFGAAGNDQIVAESACPMDASLPLDQICASGLCNPNGNAFTFNTGSLFTAPTLSLPASPAGARPTFTIPTGTPGFGFPLGEMTPDEFRQVQELGKKWAAQLESPRNGAGTPQISTLPTGPSTPSGAPFAEMGTVQSIDEAAMSLYLQMHQSQEFLPSDTLRPIADPTGVAWKDVVPRLGLTYALGAERKTLLRASYSRFADQLGHGTTSGLNPIGPDYSYFYSSVRRAGDANKLTFFPTSDGAPANWNLGPGQQNFHRAFSGSPNFPILFSPSGMPTGFSVDVFAPLPVIELPQAGQGCGDLAAPPASLFQGFGLPSGSFAGFQKVAPGLCQPLIDQPRAVIRFDSKQVADNGLAYGVKINFDDAPPSSPAARPPDDFGATLSGPIVKDRLWFFGAFNPNRPNPQQRLGTANDLNSANLWRWGDYEARTPRASLSNAWKWDSYGGNPYLSTPIGDAFGQAPCPRLMPMPPGFELAQPLTIQFPHPNDPLMSSRGTWKQGLDDQWWLKAINWLKPDGTSVLPDKAQPVTVAVIDTGLDMRHPELFGKVWVNPDEPVKSPHAGLARNPLKMRLFGWNFLAESNDTSDLNGHGTVVAGIIAANVNNRIGMAGINPWAKIMALKVADHRGRTDTIAVAKAIAFAANHGARVINISLGGNKISEAVRRAIDYAASRNVLVVVAAGNEGVDVKGFTPAAFANTIAVAAVGPDLKRAGFSNFGDNVTVAAPGIDVLSLRARGTDLMMFVRNDYAKGSAVVKKHYYRVDGTSFAAPMVAGVASLILSMRPELTAAEVKRMILQSARDVADAGRDVNLGYGLLDAEAALKADPAFFVEGAIAGMSVVQVGGQPAVRVTGTVNADRMRRAWVEIGEGENPTAWKKVTDEITRPVEAGTIGDIPAANLGGAKVWTIRLMVEHQNGRTRQARTILRLG